MSKYYDIEQWSDEYCELKSGKVSSSHFAEIMAHSIDRQGVFDDLAKWGESAKKYAMRVALERQTGKRIETFSNDWMNRGNELEPIARSKYECKTFHIVKNGGLFIDGELATSPDGLVDDGGIEIKCVKYNTHFSVLESKYYDTKYKWQIYGQQLIANLKWVDFTSYCPDFPQEKELYIHRVNDNLVEIEYLQKRLEQFKKLVNEYQTVIRI